MKRFQLILIAFVILILMGYAFNSEQRYKELLANLENERVVIPQEVLRINEPTISIDLPDSMDFSGEAVPLDIPDVRERLDKEMHINRYWHNNSIFLIKRANRWFPEIEEILKKNNIPTDFKYLAAIESGLDNVVSPKEAVGFWQILKGTGKEYGLEINNEVDERYHPIKSTEVACQYLNKAYEKFGNWTLVAASFNRGMGGVSRALEYQGVNNYYDLMLNEQTSRYVFRILACKDLLEHNEKYNFYIKPEHLYQPETMREITVTESIDDLAKFALDQGVNYKILKLYNPWLRSDELSVKKGQTYIIQLPTS